MVKNKCARLILAAFELKKLNANASAKKTLLRAMEADDAEELIDGLNDAEEDIIDDTDEEVEADSDVVVDDESTDEEVEADSDDDVDEMSDEEVVEEVEAKVKQLKASNRVKAKAKKLNASRKLKAKALRKFL